MSNNFSPSEEVKYIRPRMLIHTRILARLTEDGKKEHRKPHEQIAWIVESFYKGSGEKDNLNGR